jgi:hypothetical protein
MHPVLIKTVPNAWGWASKRDRCAYEVYLHGRLWGSYLDYLTAWKVAQRLRD